MARAVISTIGRDRPGIVNELSELVTGLALNIEDSRMTVLGGEFAVLMSISGSDDALNTFAIKLAELANAQDLQHLFRKTEARDASASALPYEVSVVAMDHPGIVHRVARFFSSREINIRDLKTETQPAPHTGTPIFSVTMAVEIPSTVKVRELKDAFETFCDEQDLDGDIGPSR